MTQEEIKKRIEMYGVIINDPSEDQGTKDLAQSKVVKLQSQLEDEDVDQTDGTSAVESGVLGVEESEDEIFGDGDAEFQEEVYEIEVKPKAKKTATKKKTPKAKGRGRPKKRGRPTKRKRTAKAPTSKQKAKKLSKAVGLSVEECEELLKKYDSENKTRKKRLSKRKKAGKSPDLTVTESLEKEAKVVKHKLEDKKTPTTKRQAKAQSSQITELVKAILKGIEGKTDKVKQIDKIISLLEAEKKRIQSQKGVGGFLFGSAVGGYTGYKLGTLQEERKVEDLFKSEKKLAKDFKDAMKEQKKKKLSTEMAKGGEISQWNVYLFDEDEDYGTNIIVSADSEREAKLKAEKEFADRLDKHWTELTIDDSKVTAEKLTYAEGGEVDRVVAEIDWAMKPYINHPDFDDEARQWEMIVRWLEENYPDREDLIDEIEKKFWYAKGGAVFMGSRGSRKLSPTEEKKLEASLKKIKKMKVDEAFSDKFLESLMRKGRR